MNKKIYNEDLILNLIVNGDKVTPGNTKLLQELYKLDDATRQFQLRNAALELQKRELVKTDTNYAAKLKLINAQMKANDTAIQSNQIAMQNLRKEIGIAGLTVNQLNTYLKVLKIQLANASDPKAMRLLRNEIQEVNTRVTTMTTGASRLSQAWSKWAREANKYSAAIGWISIAVFGIGSAVSKTVEWIGLLDRTLSGVMKTSGLTREEAMKLKREFDRMQTPTKSDDLLAIARIAGMLGITGFENIKKFTGAVDILQISLGEDLNTSVEETATKVGKLVNAFRVTDKMPIDEALLRTGSVLNELDKASVASAGTILEYMTRLSSLGTSANYPMEKLAGLGATLESVNIPAERGSTALRNIISGLGKYGDKFARILGVTTEEYRKLVETDINGTFLKLIELTAKGDKSIMDVVASMGDFEVSGVRVAEVYSALAKNIDVIRVQQAIATKAFESSASVMGEYLITLSDYQSAIDLQKKRVRALADEYNLVWKGSLYNVYKLWVDFLYLLKDLTGWISLHGRQILALIPLYAAWKSTAIAVWITSVWQANRLLVIGLWDTIKTTITANSVFIAFQKNGIRGAMVALRALWATMEVNPLGLVIGALSLLVAGVMFFTAKTDKMRNALGEMSDDMIKAKMDLNGVFEELKKSAVGTEQRVALIKTINEQYGQYLPQMLTEADNLATIEEAQRKANIALEKSISLKYQESVFDKLMQENAEKRQKAILKITSNIEKDRGTVAAGTAMSQLDKYAADVLSGKSSGDSKDIDQYGQQFLTNWDLISAKESDGMYQYLRLLKEQLKEKQRLTGFIQGYTTMNAGTSEYKYGNESTSNGPSTGSVTTNTPLMSEDTFKLKNKALETENTLRETILENRKMKDDERNLAELANERVFLNKKLALQLEYDKGDAAAVAGLNLLLAKNARSIADAGNKEIKAQEKIDKKLLDMSKIRTEAMIEGRDKDLAEEVNRSADLITEYEASRYSQAEIDTAIKEGRLKDAEDYQQRNRNVDEAVALETQNHFNKMYDINLKYIDEQLKLDTISFSERLATLEVQYQQGEIKEKDYLARKQALQDEYTKVLVRWNRKNGDVDTEAMDAEIAAAVTTGELLCATEEQIQQAITDIRKKYAQKREKNAETNAQRELRILKENFSQQQLDAFAQGEFVVGLAQQIGQGVGSAIGLLFDDTQKTNEAILKALIETVLDGAHAAIMAWYAVILAREIATKGVYGIPTAAIYMGLIEVAFGAAKALLGTWDTKKAATTTTQAASGIYPVIGADDGKLYNAGYQQRAVTGIYNEPTLIAERPEMVIDYPTLRNIKMNAPGLIDTIYQMRVPQYANGRYTTGDGRRETGDGISRSGQSQSQYAIPVEQLVVMNRFLDRIEQWNPSIAIETYERKKDNWKKITGGGLK